MFMLPEPRHDEFLLFKIYNWHLNSFVQFNVVDMQNNFQKKVGKDRQFGVGNVIIDFIKKRHDALSARPSDTLTK